MILITDAIREEMFSGWKTPKRIRVTEELYNWIQMNIESTEHMGTCMGLASFYEIPIIIDNSVTDSSGFTIDY